MTSLLFLVFGVESASPLEACFTKNTPGVACEISKIKGHSADFSQAVFKSQVWFLTGNILREEKEAKSAPKKESWWLKHIFCQCWFAPCEICVQSVDTARTDAPLATSLRASQRRGLSGTSSTRDWARASVWASVGYVHVYDWPYCKNHKKWPVPEHWGSATHYDGIIKERRWSVKGVVFSGLSNEPIYIPVVVAIFFQIGGGLKI